VDARDERVVYAAYGAGGEIGSENGAGLWMTRDGGESWRLAVDWLENSAFLSVRAHPKIGGYVAGGLRAVDYNKVRGVMLSMDGGVTWKNIGPTAPEQHIWDIAFDPRDASTLYVASQKGLWATRDTGKSWEQLLTYAASGGEFFDDAVSLAISPSGTVLLLASRGAGVQRSTDGGKTWRRVDDSWGGQKEAISVVAWAPGDELVVYAERVSGRVDKWGTTIDLLTYRSTDGGVTWQPGAVIAGRHQGRMDMAIAVDPRDANRVIVGNVDMHLSADGLRTLGSPEISPHEDHLRIAFAPSNPAVIYSGNDGGVWKSTDQGKHWRRTDAGILTTHAWGLAVSGERIYMSPGDYGMVTFDPRSGWRDAGCGGEFERVYAAPDGAVYGMRRVYPGSGRLYRMGSEREPCVELGPSTKEKLVSAMPVVFGHRDSAKIFVGLERVWRSPDRGRTWRTIGPKEPRGRILALAISPKDDRTLVALSDDGQLWLTADEGKTWRQGAKADKSRAIVFAPSEPSVLFVGGREGVFRSSDLGLTLERLAGFPARLAVQRLLVDPAWPKRLLAATDYGVVITNDAGQSWKRLDFGRPAGSVTEIALNKDVLYSTSSQGVWALPLSERKGCGSGMMVAPREPISMGSRGGETLLEVYANDGCNWTAEASGTDWIRLRTTPNAVTIRVEPNPESTVRTARLTVAGEIFEVSQQAGVDPVVSGGLVQLAQGEECLAPGEDKWQGFRRFQFRPCPTEPVFQLWRRRDRFYSLRLRTEARNCADPTGDVQAGLPLVVHPCWGVDHQAFRFLPGPAGQHRIRTTTSGLCLTRRGDGVVREPCSEDAAQLFRLK
jgi:photosystem II stability/assembly factor-like uncharacterized protein